MSTDTRPDIDTLIWWRYKKPSATNEWSLARAYKNGVLGTDGWVQWVNVEWKQAHVLAPDEVAVEIPTFPDGCNQASLRWHYQSDYDHMTDYAGVTITRAEAEKIKEYR